MSLNFKEIEQQCQVNSKVSESIIDEFLIFYAANDKTVGAKMEKRFDAYRHIFKNLPQNFEGMSKAQYLAHHIFKENGLINKYLKHSALKNITRSERTFLEFHANNPWKFAFSQIVEAPAENFYVMYDVFRDNRFLLYSPGVTKTLMENPVRLWFNLIMFNGSCWQTTGPLAGYQSFEADDIIFYYTENNPEVVALSDESLIADVEENPVPYMMLMIGSRIPLVFNKKDEMKYHSVLFPVESFDSAQLRKYFRIEYNAGVYRLSLKRWDKPPHFSIAFYDENKKEMLCTAFTENGFDKLLSKLNELGFPCIFDPDIRVHPMMINITGEILKRKITLNEYEDLFAVEPTETKTKETEKINYFLSLVIPDINDGKNPDIEKMALKAGIDKNIAEQLVAHVLGRIDKLRK